jgi:hypothetical protein
MIVSSPRMSASVQVPDSVVIGDSSVQFSDSVKNLGVTLDSHLSMQSQALNLVRAVNFEL